MLVFTLLIEYCIVIKGFDLSGLKGANIGPNFNNSNKNLNNNQS